VIPGRSHLPFFFFCSFGEAFSTTMYGAGLFFASIFCFINYLFTSLSVTTFKSYLPANIFLNLVAGCLHLLFAWRLSVWAAEDEQRRALKSRNTTDSSLTLKMRPSDEAPAPLHDDRSLPVISEDESDFQEFSAMYVPSHRLSTARGFVSSSYIRERVRSLSMHHRSSRASMYAFPAPNPFATSARVSTVLAE